MFQGEIWYKPLAIHQKIIIPDWSFGWLFLLGMGKKNGQCGNTAKLFRYKPLNLYIIKLRCPLKTTGQ